MTAEEFEEFSRRHSEWQHKMAAAKAAVDGLPQVEAQRRENDLAKAYGRKPNRVAAAAPRLTPEELDEIQSRVARQLQPEIDANARLIGSVRNQNPSAPEPLADPRTPEGYYQRNQTLGANRVGGAIQSTGMTMGGGFGSPLLVGRSTPTQGGGGPFAVNATPVVGSRASNPMIGGETVSPTEFQAAWEKKQRAKRATPTANPDAVLANNAAIQRMRGGAPIVTDLEKRQAMWEREMARKEMTKAGASRDFAAAWANNRDNPAIQAGMWEAARRPLVARGTRGGDDYGYGGGQGGIGGIVRDQAEAGLKDRRMQLEEDRLRAEIKQSDAVVEQADMQSQIAGQQAYDSTEGTEADKRRAAFVASGGKWKPMAWQQRPAPPKPQHSGVPQSLIDSFRAEGNDRMADELERRNQDLERRARRARGLSWQGIWDAWGGVEP